MKIVNSWVQNTDIFAYCVGNGIDTNFTCKEISVNGTKYAVEGFDILTSLSGSVGAILKIGGKASKAIPLGSFQVVS